MRILLIEDDAVLRDVMRRRLGEAGHRVDEAATLEQADHLWRVQAFDVEILAQTLPLCERAHAGLGSGLGLLRAARARSDRTPVLILTARNRTDERIAGLNAGADDYLGKPFDLDEVEARLRALVRRAAGSDDRVLIGHLSLDRASRRFEVEGQLLELPAREFEVLWELMTPPGRVCSKRELSAKLSDLDDLLQDSAKAAFISRLRKKLAG